MIEQQITIINKLGLHARAAAKLVTLASQFEVEVTLSSSTRTANGKSIMSVMMLAAAQGSELTLILNGKDEIAALHALVELVNNRFDEEQ